MKRMVAGLPGRLKEARQTASMTQSEIAKALGIGKRSWQDYEGGNRTPGSQVIDGLARLGFNTNWLLTGEGQIKDGRTYSPAVGPDLPRRVTPLDPTRHMVAGVYIRLFQTIVTLVDEVIEDEQIRIASPIKANLYLAIYESYEVLRNTPSKVSKEAIAAYMSCVL